MEELGAGFVGAEELVVAKQACTDVRWFRLDLGTCPVGLIAPADRRPVERAGGAPESTRRNDQLVPPARVNYFMNPQVRGHLRHLKRYRPDDHPVLRAVAERTRRRRHPGCPHRPHPLTSLPERSLVRAD